MPVPHHQEAARAARRRALLEAGVSPLLSVRPWAEIRMADVAAEAGVSRQTLYAEFGSREGLARAYVASEAERFLGMVDASLDAHPTDAVAAMRAALETFLTAARQGGLLTAVVARGGNEELLALLTTQGGDVVDGATERLVRYFSRHWPGADQATVRVGARNLVRLALSHATLPEAEPEETAEVVTGLFAPYLRSLTGA